MPRPLPAGKGAGTFPAPAGTENSWLLCHSRRALSTAGRSGWRRVLLPRCPCRGRCPLARGLQRYQRLCLQRDVKSSDAPLPSEGLCSLSLTEEVEHLFRQCLNLCLGRRGAGGHIGVQQMRRPGRRCLNRSRKPGREAASRMADVSIVLESPAAKQHLEWDTDFQEDSCAPADCHRQ